MSWAVVDYYLVPKPAYYAIKRAMELIAVGVTRKFHNWTMRPADELWQRDTSHIDMRKIWEDIEFDVWISSNRLEKLHGMVTVKFVSIKTGEEVLPSILETIVIQPNATTEVLQRHRVKPVSEQKPDSAYEIMKADPFVIYATLTVDDQTVSSDISWPDPIKYLSFADRGIEIKCSNNGSTLTVSASKPVKGFTFGEKQGISLSDNGFDIMPGTQTKIVVAGGNVESLDWTFVGK